MARNIRRDLESQGRWEPEKWRKQREQTCLDALLLAWSEASERVQAEFLVQVGWTQDLPSVESQVEPQPPPKT